ncbi:MAG: hypothetical protein ACRDUV_22725 [Pseudonocardiaceae bacterium]
MSPVVTMPLFLMLAGCALVAVRWGSTKPGGVILGVLVGLTMAGTSFGPPLLDGLDQLTSTMVSSLSSATGQG